MPTAMAGLLAIKNKSSRMKVACYLHAGLLGAADYLHPFQIAHPYAFRMYALGIGGGQNKDMKKKGQAKLGGVGKIRNG